MRPSPYGLVLLLTAVTASSLQGHVARGKTDPDPERYSSCAVEDSGFVPADAVQAANFVVEKLIPSEGRYIITNYCYYKLLNTTVVSVCNGAARNRTITADETRRGIDQIVKDCGVDSGYHVVNNLTFSMYGVRGGMKALVPKTFAYPDFPGWADEETEIIPVL